MKKALIAGAASLAIAAMPVVGVFAVGTGETIMDTLELTIGDNCAFTRQAEAHGATDATWTNVTDETSHVFTKTVQNGQTYDGIASSNFNVVCNNLEGYEVTVATTGFTADTITGAEAWAYNGGAYAQGNGSSWFLTSTGAGADLTGSNNTVATEDSATSSTDFSVTYNARVSATQQADTYTATATYTFAQL